MATIVYQGLQSCLESQLVEPRALKLRLSSPIPHFSQPLELALKSCFLDSNTEEINKKNDCLDDKCISSSPDLGGWSFLQSLSCSSLVSNETIEKESSYVHPMVTSSTSLSEKSLALCTENLGNETGADVNESSIFSLTSFDVENGNYSTREARKSRQGLKSRKANVNHSFPPPLTTMRGSEYIQVRPHRGDGRLVIKATKAPSPFTCFQAERSNGRLRLCLLKDSPASFDHEEYEANKRIEFENNINFEEEGEHAEEGEEEKDSLSGGMVGGAAMGIEKLRRPGRCVDGENESRGLLNLEPFWVATS